MPIEIIPHLWLGDYKDAKHLLPCTSIVVNCTPNIPFFGEQTTNIRIPVIDLDDSIEQETMLKHWTSTDLFKDMLNHIMQDRDVLVHCQMGRQRSAATVAAFLMTTGMPMDAAIAFIKTKKRDAFFPEVNFKSALTQFSRMINMIKLGKRDTKK